MPARPLPVHGLVPLVAATLVLATALVPRPASAAWPSDSTTNLRVSAGPGGEYDAVLVASKTGSEKAGVIVAWSDYRNGASNKDVYGQRILANGAIDTRWPAGGLPVCTQSGAQERPAIVGDGSGGAIIVWRDQRPGDGDGFFNLYAHHVRPDGTLDPAWPATGAPVCRAAGDQYAAQLVTDGAGGSIVVWSDFRSGASDIYANRVLASGVIDGAWPANGRVVCSATGGQYAPLAISDGAGGAIVTWTDERGAGDIYVQRMNGATAMPMWATNGVAVCALASGQNNPSLVPDGAGGAVVAWEDQRNLATNGTDIYAHHVTSAGALDASWPVDGRAVATAASGQGIPVAVSDGAGGALIVYVDYQYRVNGALTAQYVLASGALYPTTNWWYGVGLGGSAAGSQMHRVVSDGAGGLIACWIDNTGGDIYAQRVLGSGLVDPRWRSGGNPVCLAVNGQTQPALVAVDDGDAIAVWSDFRSGTARLYAQRVTCAGTPGMSAPNIADVQDVPSDQGGKVHVLWESSGLDVPALAGITDYRLWRRLDLGGTEYWEFLAQVPARGAGGYAFMAATTADSTSAGPAWNTFRVTAHATDGLSIFASGLQSGCSVDNLAPAAPQQFAGDFANGTTTLRWSAVPDPDVAAYRVYRGDAADFAAGPATLLAEVPGTSYADAAGSPHWYRVGALDVHGNEGATALLGPAAVTGAEPSGAPGSLALSPPRPNPARESAEFEITLPHAATVSVAVYDVGGRLVRGLSDASLPAGRHRLAWDTADGRGASVAGGLYFVRLEVAGTRLVRHLAVLR